MKVKEYKYLSIRDGLTHKGLYSSKLYVPGPSTFGLMYAISYIYLCVRWDAWDQHATGPEILFSLLGGLILLGALALVGMGIASIKDQPQGFLMPWYFNKREFPDGYRSEFLKEPEYQTILQEYVNGSNISHLKGINKLLERKRELEGYDIQGVRNSKVVEETSESLKAYVKAMEDAKATYDELQKSYPVGGTADS